MKHETLAWPPASCGIRLALGSSICGCTNKQQIFTRTWRFLWIPWSALNRNRRMVRLPLLNRGVEGPPPSLHAAVGAATLVVVAAMAVASGGAGTASSTDAFTEAPSTNASTETWAYYDAGSEGKAVEGTAGRILLAKPGPHPKATTAMQRTSRARKITCSTAFAIRTCAITCLAQSPRLWS